MKRARMLGSSGVLLLVAGAAAWMVAPSMTGGGNAKASAVAAPTFPEVNECFADGWTPAPEALLAAAKPCKPCRDRPWCECTYQGAHRISCNPCCYQNYAGDIICFD